PSATITASSPVCANSTNNASVPTAGAGASYGWTISGGTITSSTTSSNITYVAGTVSPVTLNVSVTNANGCVSNNVRSITITALPDVTITSASAVCYNSVGNTASVPPQTGATYTWTISGGTITSVNNTSNVTFTAGTGTSLTLTVTKTLSGCSASNSKVVTI